MLIPINITHAFYPGSDKLMNALTLRILEDTLIALDRTYLVESKRAGYAVPLLYESGVVYDRTTWWEPTQALYKRGFGDCKSLTATRVAELRLQGVACAPTFRWVENLNGSVDYHILVQHADGTFEDPSKKLGMGAQEVAKFYGPKSY